ncbi:MAG: hypothetical protein WCF45_10415 [Photobacterium halotolerans]
MSTPAIIRFSSIEKHSLIFSSHDGNPGGIAWKLYHGTAAINAPDCDSEMQRITLINAMLGANSSTLSIEPARFNCFEWEYSLNDRLMVIKYGKDRLGASWDLAEFINKEIAKDMRYEVEAAQDAWRLKQWSIKDLKAIASYDKVITFSNCMAHYDKRFCVTASTGRKIQKMLRANIDRMKPNNPNIPRYKEIIADIKSSLDHMSSVDVDSIKQSAETLLEMRQELEAKQ